MAKYEIINPSDKCFIYAEDVRLAKIACKLLSGFYGLVDENGEAVIGVFDGLDTSLGMNLAEAKHLIDCNRKALAQVFRSFEYEGERTSLNNIVEKAEKLAAVLEKED